MSRRAKALSESDADVDMTPMLDIVFILLIFFIVTTSFVKESGLEVTKPKSNVKSDNNKPSIVIKVSEDGLIRFNNKLVDIERVTSRIENFLANHADTTTVLLIPSEETTYEVVVGVMDQIKNHPSLTIAIGK